MSLNSNTHGTILTEPWSGNIEKYDTRNRCYRVKSLLCDQFGWEQKLCFINVPVLSLLILQLDMLNTCRSGIFKNLIGFATSEALLCLSVVPQTTQLFWRKLAPHRPLSTSFAKCFCLSVGGELPPLCIPPLPPSRRQLCAPLGWEHCGQSSLCTVLLLILRCWWMISICLVLKVFFFVFVCKTIVPFVSHGQQTETPMGGGVSLYMAGLCFLSFLESHLFESGKWSLCVPTPTWCHPVVERKHCGTVVFCKKKYVLCLVVPGN